MEIPVLGVVLVVVVVAPAVDISYRFVLLTTIQFVMPLFLTVRYVTLRYTTIRIAVFPFTGTLDIGLTNMTAKGVLDQVVFSPDLREFTICSFVRSFFHSRPEVPG